MSSNGSMRAEDSPGLSDYFLRSLRVILAAPHHRVEKADGLAELAPLFRGHEPFLKVPSRMS